MRNAIKSHSLLLVSLLFLFSPVIRAAEDTTVIKAGKIYTATRGVITQGMILVKNGKIIRLGENLTVPKGAKTIEAGIVIPGLIDIHSHLGVYSVPGVPENEDGNEMTDPVTPQVRALDSFNFDDPALKTALAGGVTTIVSRPGSGNVIGGTSIAVKLKNADPDGMILKEICDLKMTIEGNPIQYHGRYNRMPTSMMGVYHLARKAFVEAQTYMENWEQFRKDLDAGEKVNPPARDLGKDVLVMALKREIPVHIHINTASEIMSCIRLADEFNLRLILAHCQWAYLIKDKLAKRKDVHFNCGPAMFSSYYDDTLVFKNVPAILANAGANVSLQIDAVAGRQPGQQHLLHTAALCVRYGMLEDHALKAITIRGAEAEGLDDRIGSIEEGKAADLVFLDGEPFELLTSVEKVMIDGRIEYQKGTQEGTTFHTTIKQAKEGFSQPLEISENKTFAIRAGTVITMAGPRIKDGIVLVKNGKIEKVGEHIPIPKEYKIVDAREFVVMPGLISARSEVGLSADASHRSSRDEMFKAIAPELEIKHALEPQDPLFSSARKLGVTTIQVTPGDRNVIGGQGIVIKTAGSVVDKMIVKDNSVMMVGLGSSAKRKNSMPSTRMGIAALLRETLVKAQEYRDKIEISKKGNDDSTPPRDLSLEALLPVVNGEMPLMMHCERKDDILTALRIADEFGLKIVLTGASEAYKIVDEIKKRKIPVVLETVFRGGGNIEDRDFSEKNPVILSKAGIPVNFTLSDYFIWYIPMGLMGADPLEIAAYVYKNGMSEDAALRAVTIDAARIIGCEDRVGSLEPGKDADILILRGHPFQTRSIPEAVFIDGRLIYQRSERENL
ncbi:MAG: amidohydrolase family protein [Candidatus Aminicenantes bacterium]|nr:amidohydrolase family protein [Candidatus Aminicenantes bacterium]